MGLPVFVVALRDATLDGVTGVQPCVGITVGLDAAARAGTAQFILELTLIYFTQGRIAHVRAAVPVRDTIRGQNFDARTVLVETVIKTQVDGGPVPQPDERGMFTASARLIVNNPQQTTDEVVAPTTSSGLVGGIEPLPG